MIIGLCGPKLSGKGTTAAYLMQQHHAHLYSMSGILRTMLDHLHVAASRENMIGLALRLREQFGADVLAKAVTNNVKDDRPSYGIIDGIRYEEEWKIFSQLAGFQLWYIDAPLDVRYQRQTQRDEKVGERDQSFEDFVKEEQAQTEQGIAALRAHATHILANDGTIEALHHRIDTLLRTKVT